MSIADDFAAIRSGMDRLKGDPAPPDARMAVTVWALNDPNCAIMHLSADEFDGAMRQLVEDGFREPAIVDLPAPGDEEKRFRNRFQDAPYPGPHRHVQVFPGKRTS